MPTYFFKLLSDMSTVITGAEHQLHEMKDKCCHDEKCCDKEIHEKKCCPDCKNSDMKTSAGMMKSAATRGLMKRSVLPTVSATKARKRSKHLWQEECNQ